MKKESLDILKNIAHRAAVMNDDAEQLRKAMIKNDLNMIERIANRIIKDTDLMKDCANDFYNSFESIKKGGNNGS